MAVPLSCLLLFLPHQCQEFVPRLLVVAKRTEHRTGHGLPVLLFNATHLHAQVLRLDNHSDALRGNLLFNRPRDLAGHALLNLQSPREHVHQPCDFAQSDYLFARQICHVCLSKERQQVMLAQAEKLDVLDDDHLVIAHAERRAIQQMVHVLVIPTGQEFQRFLVTLRRLLQTFALRILSDKRDHFTHQRRHGLRLRFFLVMQQNLFRRFCHDALPFLFPSYSKLLFEVSCTRTRSSFALGKAFSRSKISIHKFSVVGTVSRNAATSSFSERQSNRSMTSRSTKLSKSAKFAIIPVAGSTSPETPISST